MHGATINTNKIPTPKERENENKLIEPTFNH